MHKNKKLHLEKLDQSVFWLARWGVCDAQTLCRAASILSCEPGRKPSVQARHWPSLLVEKGFANLVELDDEVAGSRRVFIATRTARMHTTAAGFELSDPYKLNIQKLAHRLIIQRATLDLLHYSVSHGAKLLSYVSESEMPALSAKAFREAEEHLNRWPDAQISLELADEKKRSIYLEIEVNPRWADRLAAMCAGLADLTTLPRPFRADAALVLVSGSTALERYAEALKEGAGYEPHKRLGLEYVPAGGVARMPPDLEVIEGWTVPPHIAERVTKAARAEDDWNDYLQGVSQL